MIGWVWWAACQREPARELPRLLYVSEEGALVADDPAGEARVLVASGVERVAWAPSGRRASFVGPGEIGVVDLVGGGTTRLADGDADTRFGQYGWAFSPDEGSLLYSVQPDPGGVGHRVVDLSTGLTVALPPGALSSIYNWVDDEHLHDWYQVCPANGGACSPFPCASGMSQAVGPDEVACAIEDRLTTYSLPGLRPLGSARLEVSAGSEGPHRLEWSPDGATLAWLTADAVWFADRDAAVMTRVEVDWPVDHFGPTPVDLASWSPDGKWLLCSGIHEVFVLGVDGTEVASWTWWDGKGPPWPSLSSLSFGWSADGAWAWWLRTDDTSYVFEARALHGDGGSTRVEAKVVSLLAASPSGRFVVLRTYRVDTGFADLVCALGRDCVNLPAERSWAFGAEDLLAGMSRDGDLSWVDPRTGAVEDVAEDVVAFAVRAP
jgi:hypothetical protein